MLPLLVIAALVALVWGAVYFRHAGFLGGCVAVLLLGSVFGHPFFNVGPVTTDRLMVAVLAVALVALRWHRLVEPRPITRADGLLLALLAVLALSTFTHDWRAGGMKSAVLLVVFYGLPAALYFVAREMPLDDRRLTRLLWFFVAFGCYLGLTALAEVAGAWSVVFPRYIVSPHHVEFLGRGRGPFLNPVANGIYLGVAVVSAVMLWPSTRTAGRIALAGAIALGLAGAYVTLTRSVWGAVGLTTLLAVACHVPKRWRMPLVVSAAMAGALVVAVKWQDLSAFKRDKHVSVADMARSAELRPLLATIAWQMFQDRPLFGCGFGQYATEVKPYFSARTSELPLVMAKGYVQHNVFLALLTETGLLGAGMLVALLATWGWSGWKLWRDPHRRLLDRQQGLMLIAMLIAYTVNGMFHDVSIIAMVHMLLFFQAGLVRNLTPSPARQAARAWAVAPNPLRQARAWPPQG